MDGLDFDSFVIKFRYPILILLGGLVVLGIGVIFFKTGFNFSGEKVEILNTVTESAGLKNITVEIEGEVEKPGVYKMSSDSRIDDLLVISGGLTASADRTWIEKYLNRAARLSDGQKIYIPKVGKQTLGASDKINGGDQSISSSISTDSNDIININTASLKELDSLPGIGQTYGQNIIEHRPYSTIEELVSKGAVKQSVFEKIKNKITVY